MYKAGQTLSSPQYKLCLREDCLFLYSGQNRIDPLTFITSVGTCIIAVFVWYLKP